MHSWTTMGVYFTMGGKQQQLIGRGGLFLIFASDSLFDMMDTEQEHNYLLLLLISANTVHL